MLNFPARSDRPPVQVAPAETPGLRSLLTIAVAFVVVAGLYFGRSVLIPLTLAVLLSFLLAPLVSLLRRGHLGRIPRGDPGARRSDRHTGGRTGR